MVEMVDNFSITPERFFLTGVFGLLFYVGDAGNT